MPVNVHSLPAEVLCDVFLYLSLASPCVYIPRQKLYSGWKPAVRQLGWFPPVMQTCHKWRAVALGFAELWARNICSFQSEDATGFFMEHAKELSDLIFDHPPHTERDVIGHEIYEPHVLLAEANIGRVKVFKQSESGPIPSSFAKALFATALPKLVILHLHRWDDLDSMLIAKDIALDAPALEELSLVGVLFTVKAPSLRVLEVNSGGLRCPTYSQPILHSLLTTTPLLEQLAVHHMFVFPLTQPEGDPNATPTEVANLPSLHTLRIETRRPGENLSFFKFVNPSPDVSILIEVNSASVDYNLREKFEVMERYMRHPAYDTLVLTESWGYAERPDILDAFRISISLCSSTFRNQRVGCKPDFKIEGLACEPDPQRFSWLELLQAIALRADIEKIKFLDLGKIGVDRLAHTETDDVRNFLALFTGVTTARLDARPPSGTQLSKRFDPEEIEHFVTSKIHISAVHPTNARENTDASLLLPLPALEHLLVHGFYLGAWATVRETLEKRKRAGCPVRFLTLCDVYPSPPVFDVDQRHDAVRAICAEGLVEQVCDRGVWVNMHSGSRGDCPLVLEDAQEL